MKPTLKEWYDAMYNIKTCKAHGQMVDDCIFCQGLAEFPADAEKKSGD